MFSFVMILVDARQEIDLRLGAAFTRFQTLRLQAKFYQLSKLVVTYGPCQFPTLGFVVERYMKRLNFIPENFWSISCEIEAPDPDEASGKLSTNFRWKRGNVYDQLPCVIMYQLCVEAGAAKVIECSARSTSKYKPVPLNTIEMQKRASRYLRISSDEAMAAAESLYQQGILSYPRTETDFFKEGFELMPLLQDHLNNPDWGQFTQYLLNNNGFEAPKSGGHDDQAHPPIHPTKSVALADLHNPKERAIYELISRHFLACCAKDAKGDQTTVRIQFVGVPGGCGVGGSKNEITDGGGSNNSLVIAPELIPGEVFEATGLMIRERNWLDVYKWDKWYATKVRSN
jgi:DNA topoisomerase-3